MADELPKPQNEETEEEIRRREKKRAKLKKQCRDYYERNKHWILEENRRKYWKEKRRRLRQNPELKYEAERKRAERKEQTRLRNEEWNEIGKIIAKMNLKLNLNQQEIYELLGGLYTRKKISEWCARGKKSLS